MKLRLVLYNPDHTFRELYILDSVDEVREKINVYSKFLLDVYKCSAYNKGLFDVYKCNNQGNNYTGRNITIMFY